MVDDKSKSNSYGFGGCYVGHCPNLDRKLMANISLAETLRIGQTGDLILVSGMLPFSFTIRRGSQSFYSHVAMLIRNPNPKMWQHYGKLRNAKGMYSENGGEVPRDKVLYMFDSDFENDGSLDGPVLRPLEDMLVKYVEKGYHGRSVDVVLRRLEVSRRKKRNELVKKLETFAASVSEAKYMTTHVISPRFLTMTRACYDGNKQEDWSRFFCSQLVAGCYMHMGLLPENGTHTRLAVNYMPQDFAAPHGRFSPKNPVDINTILPQGLHLSNELRIDFLDEVDQLSSAGVGAPSSERSSTLISERPGRVQTPTSEKSSEPTSERSSKPTSEAKGRPS